MKKQTEFRIKIAAQILVGLISSEIHGNDLGEYIKNSFRLSDKLIQRGIEDEQKKKNQSRSGKTQRTPI